MSGLDELKDYTTRPRIIGLCGDIGAGKDTVAEHLALAHDYTRGAFANKLKQVAADVFGLDRSVWGTQEQKREPITHVKDAAGEPRTGRWILEWLGTEGFRTIDPDVWVKYAMREVDIPPMCLRWVFTDVRFRNEFEAIRERGGLVWEVVKVGGPDHGRTGHRSDEEWRSIPRDNIVAAAFGDIKGLERAADLALEEGRMHQDLRG